MTVYVYFKESKIISCKIDNVDYISDNDKEIRGTDNSARYGDSQDFICLSDDINKNIGDVINLDVLTDERSYFIDKEQWYQEQIKQAKEIISNLNSDNFNTMMALTELYEMVTPSTTTT